MLFVLVGEKNGAKKVNEKSAILTLLGSNVLNHGPNIL
jgi:hypothetical protein